MQETTWNGFKRLDFLFEDREAILIVPDKANEDKNWLFKTEYFEAFPNLELAMLKRGWHVAFIKNKTRWALDEDIDLKARFAEFLGKEFGLYKKCVPVGMSCGGLIGSRFTMKYPNLVSALYLDAPVLNFLSCPAAVGKAEISLLDEFVQATGITLSELTYYRNNPIDKMHILLENGTPIIMVYGDSDEVVPYCENGAVLEKFYRENGGIIETYGKAGCKHHPHGLEDSTPLINFVEKYSK